MLLNEMKKITTVFLLFFLPFFAFTQTPEVSKKEAKDYFNDGDFREAKRQLEILLQSNPNNTSYNYMLAMCYLQGTIDWKGKAIPYLEKIKDADDAPKDLLYWLAKAYHYDYQFDKAIELYNQFISETKDEFLQNEAKRATEQCQYAKQLVANRKMVQVQNMGKDINSPEPDYYPFVDEEESILVFSTRRDKGNPGYIMTDGYKSADVFISKVKNGVWSRARSIGGAVGTALDEEVVGMPPDGSMLFINIDSYEISGDISVAERKGNQFQKPKPLGENINTPYVEITGTVNKDHTVLYFSSDRPGGYGGFDIYKSHILPDGTWGPAINLGPVINTPYDEFFPMLYDDDKTLYFSSNGHLGMGDHDLFKSEWNEEKQTWGSPQNLGYPINTTDNDLSISFNKTKRVAYISSIRKNGLGDLDIYSISFPEIEPEMSVITGRILAMAPIDYNDYQTFNYYQVGEQTKRIPAEFTPPDPSWKLLKTETKTVKPGYRYKVSVVMEKSGKTMTFSLEKAPLDDPSYTFKDVKVSMIPIKGYKPRSSSAPKETAVDVADPFITVFDHNTGDLFGEYIPNSHSKKFTIILPPGKYDIEISAEGFKPFNKTIQIMGKASFKPLIKRDFYLEPETPLPAVHYSKLKEKNDSNQAN